jgi:hypothetical protein
MEVSRFVVFAPDISAPGLRYVTSIQDSLSDNYAPSAVWHERQNSWISFSDMCTLPVTESDIIVDLIANLLLTSNVSR